jgi:hypothetical protein
MGDKHLQDIFNDVLKLVSSRCTSLLDSILALVPQSNSDYIACIYLVTAVGCTFLYGMWFMRIEYLFQMKKKKALQKKVEVEEEKEKGGVVGGGGGDTPGGLLRYRGGSTSTQKG